MALPMMTIGTARADQIRISQPKDQVVMETPLGVQAVIFQIQNTGAPHFAPVTFGPITESVLPRSGDTNLDIIMSDITVGCDAILLPSKSCTLTASYDILDADPFDEDEADPGDPGATWYFRIDVPWTDTLGGSGTAHKLVIITVIDDPVPEPTTLSLLGTGLLAFAGVARRRLRAHD